jgi:ectoine hydroxylase-related dioxygenase (phytanoyl-CoA dioxygenase family)
MISLNDYKQIMETRGWIVIENMVPTDLVQRMAEEIVVCYETCRALQKKNGIDSVTAYTVHHLVGQTDSYLEYLETMKVAPYIEAYFEGKYILNSFGGAINTARSTSYAQNIHRDIRTFSGDLKLMLNTLVMLDDFTPDNGSTWLMSGSHTMAEKPTEEQFMAKAEQALGPKGSVLLFNSNLWHKGGDNNTDFQRRSVTPMFTKPFFKPQFDYCKAIGVEKVKQMPKHLQQLLGYYSRVPESLNEWYQPPELRTYRPDQG